MTLYINSSAGAYAVKAQFREFGRDIYPLEVYQAIFDMELSASEEGRCKLDVVSWCCDIHESTLADVAEVETFADLVKFIDRRAMILFTDETAGIIYHMAY